MINFKKVFSASVLSILISTVSFAEDNKTISQSKDNTNSINTINKSIIFKSKNNASSYKDLEGNVEKIFNDVQVLRKLKAKNQVTVGIKDTQELNSFLGKMFKEEYTDNDIRIDYLTLLHFGLIKKETNLKKTFLDLYSEQIAGFYDNNSKELYVIDNPKISEIESQIVISHELIHALQDQYFNLTDLISGDKNKNQDSTLAKMSLVEGEAMLGSVEYMTKSLTGNGMESLKALSGLFKNPVSGSLTDDVLKQTPGFLVEQMMFPYTSGMKFASSLKEYYGWEDFYKVYNSPPVSTEQIIHPEKYIAGEKPVQIKIDENILKDKNYKFLKKDTFGEFFLYNYFLEYLDENESEKASYGWGGDNSLLFADKNNNSIIVYKSVWDTNLDAREFFNSYKKSLNVRFANNLKNIQNNNSLFLAKTDKGLVYITIKDNMVNIAEGFNENMKDKFINYFSKK